MTRQAHLPFFLNPIGEHPAALGLSARRYAGASGLTALAQEAETALFDAVFVADSPAAGGPGTAKSAASLPSSDGDEQGGARERFARKYEPVTLLSAIAVRTSRIGLIATSSTTFFEPYNIARLFASLDLLSEGRAGWNAVTTSHPRAAKNFGNTLWADHAKRYEVADEFLTVVEGLWDERRGVLGHEGEFFQVAGPLDIPPSPQGHPLISQAGGSPEGIALAGTHAELVFAIQPSLEVSRRFVAEVRAAATKAGRDAAALRITPGVIPYLARTRDEAVQYKEHLDSLVDLEPLYALTARYLHIEEGRIRDLSPESAFPAELLPDVRVVDNSVGTFLHLSERIRSDRLTVAQTLIAAAGGRHREIAGTPEDFATDLIQWLEADAADGFVFMPPFTERDVPFFVEEVVPVLQQRGLFRRRYAGATLRENLR